MNQTEELLVGAKFPNAFKVNYVTQNLSYLMGEILTLVDASIEGDKNKAIKDIIKKTFSNTQNKFWDLALKEIKETDIRHSEQPYAHPLPDGNLSVYDSMIPSDEKVYEIDYN